MFDWFEIMKFGIVLFALSMSYAQYRQAMRMKKYGMPSTWVHLGLAIMGIYWAAYYLRSGLGFAPFEAHQVFIRGPLMITIALISAAGAYGTRRYK